MPQRELRLLPPLFLPFVKSTRKPRRRKASFVAKSPVLEQLEVRQLLSGANDGGGTDDSGNSDDLEQFSEVERPYVEFARSLDYTEFRQLKGWQVKYLTAGQLQTMPNNRFFRKMPGWFRKRLTEEQIQSLDVRRVGLLGITRGQINMLTTEQIQRLKLTDFRRLSPHQIPDLTVSQIRQIPSNRWFRRFKPAARQALTDTQFMALNVRQIGLRDMSADQIGNLTANQVRALYPRDFRYLSAEQLPLLSADQLAWFNSDWIVDQVNGGENNVELRLTEPETVSDDVQVGDRTVGEIRQLSYQDFRHLSTEQIRYLTRDQIFTIPNNWWFTRISSSKRAELLPDQIRGLNTRKVGIESLNDEQVACLDFWQIRILSYSQFKHLYPTQVPHLTENQLGSIPNGWWFTRMSDELRAELNRDQVQALPVRSLGLSGLSEEQVDFLNVEQIQGLDYRDFKYLDANQTPHLTAVQVGTIPNSWWFTRMSEEARAGFGRDQVQALEVSELGLGGLTDQQVAHLTHVQIESISYREFRHLLPVQIPRLTNEQISTIPNEWWFTRMPERARAAVTGEQVMHLDVASVGLARLTEEQIESLSVEQIQSLDYRQFQHLNEHQTPHLTTGQLATIPNEWWFRRLSEAARAALTGEQVRALNVAELGLGDLSDEQIPELSDEQIQAVDYREFEHLTAPQITVLTTEQIASIPNGWWFKRIPEDVRSEIAGEQVRALNVDEVGLSGLTHEQIGELSDEQVRQAEYRNFELLHADQIPLLTADQIGTIANGWWFGRIPAESRARLTQGQVRALPVAQTGIYGLTDEQVAWLTTDQIQALGKREFHRLSSEQIVLLTPEQVGSIDSSWWFSQIPEMSRFALTPDQVRALNVHVVGLKYLSGSQRREITPEQIATLTQWNLRYLTADQMQHVTREQLAGISNSSAFTKISHESRAALSRDQMLAVPNAVIARMNHQPSHLVAPTEDEGPVHEHGSENHVGHGSDSSSPDNHDDHNHDEGLPHTDDENKRHEHLAVFELVPHEEATFVSIASGDWSDPSVWEGNTVPGEDAQVLISAETTVTFDVVQYDAMNWVRVDGRLNWDTDDDTQMYVDTVIVDSAGLLQIGAEDSPVEHGVAARIVIADNGEDIDTDWDPNQLSRGVISHGSTQLWGEEVTPYVSLATDPRRGDTELFLDEVPTNWEPGHRLVLTGTSSNWRSPQDEELEIVAINGTTVVIDSDSEEDGIQPLEFHHLTPEGFGTKVYVANMNRNVVIMSENPSITQRRGHVMMMHNQRVQIHNVGLYGLGRTDKRNPANDPVFRDDGTLFEDTGLNARGRYSLHFHRAGTSYDDTPGLVTGSAVVDSPGWGYVNHQSYVNMVNNVAFNVVGAAFVTEFGDELGAFVDNLSIRNSGSGDGLESREDIFDFAHGGHGFWFQGPAVEAVGNIATGARDSAFNFFTTSSEVRFPAENLDDPTIAAGRSSVPVGTVPLKRVENNTAFASRSGLETWFHLTHMNDGQSYIDGFKSWNNSRAMFTPYTGRTTIRDAVLLGNTSGGGVGGTAIGRNNVTNQMTYENITALGWDIAISAPVNRDTTVVDGHFAARRAIYVATTHDTSRTVDILGDPQFDTLTGRQLRDREQFDVFLNGSIDLKNRDLETYFSPDIVRLGTVRFNNHEVYYPRQAADYVPFDETSPEWVPGELRGKTNTELWNEYGIAPGGTVAPDDAIEVDRINGLVGSRTDYPDQLRLRSRKYTNELQGYQLRFIDGNGDLVVDDQPVELREGWNLLTREVNGETRTLFVYGDITAPEFILDTERTDLRVHPEGLEFGITIRGTVIDDSFGEMHFRKKFKDLEEREIHTDDDGTQFILLTFHVRDLAGNATAVTLRVVLDPDAPLVPGTGQRDLPPRPVPTTLAELLEYYFLTGDTEGELVLDE